MVSNGADVESGGGRPQPYVCHVITERKNLVKEKANNTKALVIGKAHFF